MEKESAQSSDLFVHTHCDTPARTNALVYARTYTNINTHAHKHAICVYTEAYLYTLYTYIHTCICAYIQTCIHKYM